MNKITALLLASICVALSQYGCQSSSPNNSYGNEGITHGDVQLHLRKGTTTKSQVLEAFGSPNITTRDSNGREVWTYQRHNVSAESTSSYGTLLLVGASSGSASQSSKTMTLIIKFNNKDIVVDYDSRYSNF